LYLSSTDIVGVFLPEDLDPEDFFAEGFDPEGFFAEGFDPEAFDGIS